VPWLFTLHRLGQLGREEMRMRVVMLPQSLRQVVGEYEGVWPGVLLLGRVFTVLGVDGKEGWVTYDIHDRTE
jgi:hypothetical protein